ncbi:OmpA family protein [Parahaliea maris]|nr:OmpA family protein [Parahaliea maris]
MIPSSGALKVEPPAGDEQLSVWLTPEPLPGLSTTPPEEGWKSLPPQEADELSQALQAFARQGALAGSTTTYTVKSMGDDLQFTTRAILRQVEAAQSSPRNGSTVTSFSVDAIRFEFGTAVPTDSGIAQMDAFGEAMLDPMLADMKVLIAGHTDDQGSADLNQDLSIQRSMAVKSYFCDNYGVDPQRVLLQGFGESRPTVPNDSEQNRARNRRVEITFMY